MTTLKKVKAVFLDRDGVINQKLPNDRYVREPSEFLMLPGVVEALSILGGLGFLLIIVTNQRGIARGIMTSRDLEKVHESLERALAVHGVLLDDIYHCPHDECENCYCRKPKPGMLMNARRKFGIDLESSYMVGDSESDIEAGAAAGAHTVRIGSVGDAKADMVFKTLLDFALFMKRAASSCP
jgi:histidinol-phosphate phosphatase family protein